VTTTVVSAGSSLSGLSLSSGDLLEVLSGGTASATIVNSGGVIMLSGGVDRRTDVGAGGEEEILSGGRAISSIWISMGISMFILLLSLGLSGRTDQQLFVAVIAAMLGTTNAASGMILKWKQQFACGVVWWLAAIVSCFGSVAQSVIAFLIAIFVCQILFGVYGMVLEARMRKQREAAHA